MSTGLINKLAGMSNDQEALAKIGSELVRKAVKEAAAEKAGLTPVVDPDSVVTLPPGSKIPPEWMIENANLLADGTLATGWEKTWTNLVIWDRNWSQNETGLPDVDFTNAETILKLEDVLDPGELQALEQLQLINR